MKQCRPVVEFVDEDIVIHNQERGYTTQAVPVEKHWQDYKDIACMRMLPTIGLRASAEYIAG